MIAGSGHRHRETLEDSFVVVHDCAGLAMHDMSCADHTAPECFADRLVSEAHSQHWNLTGEMADQLDADSCLMRRTRAGRDHNSLRTQAFDLADGHLIVAANLDLGSQLADVLHQVVGERIVVVEYKNHAGRSCYQLTPDWTLKVGVAKSLSRADSMTSTKAQQLRGKESDETQRMNVLWQRKGRESWASAIAGGT